MTRFHPRFHIPFPVKQTIMNPALRILSITMLVLTGCSVTETPPAGAVQGSESNMSESTKAARAEPASRQAAVDAGVRKPVEEAVAEKPVGDAGAEKVGQDAGRCWAPTDRRDLRGMVIVITREVTFQELARQLETTVDHLNAINELELQPWTLLARGSELYFTREPAI